MLGEKNLKYFGTDGFRGEVNLDLTSHHAYRIGRFLGWFYSRAYDGGSGRARIVIGKDTRRSSYMLEYSIAAGIVASGADAYMLHVITTPGVSYVTRLEGFDAGIMITASHNPFYDNGIKVINRFGEKLDLKTTALMESYIDGDMSALSVNDKDLPIAKRENIGRIYDHSAGRNRYVGYLISLVSNSFKGLRIGLDLANGAARNVADSVFSALGADVYSIGAEPDGMNINRQCGSTHIEGLKALIKDMRLDVGFAFDGDGDRCIAVDENGRVVDGDSIIYILAKKLKDRGALKGDTVIATVMSNSGFEESLEKIGIKCIRTSVGDRFVYEKMQEGDYSLGGEQSGHVILRKYATTGDGILTALLIAEEMRSRKAQLSSLCRGLTLYPQETKSIRVADKAAAVSKNSVKEALQNAKKLLSDGGRILLRESGTEPVIRIMVEAKTHILCLKCIEIMENAIREGDNTID